MSKILAWAKANPLIVVSVALVVVSLAGVGVLQWYWSGQNAAPQQQVDRYYAKANGLLATEVSIPSAEPDRPPQTTRLCINAAAVEALQRVHQAIQGQHAEVSRAMLERNRGRHGLLIDGVLPQPAMAQAVALRDVYRKKLVELLERAPGQRTGLRAGMPPTSEEIKNVMVAVERDYLGGQTQIMSVGSLNPVQARHLRNQEATRLMDVLRERAQSLQIYAITRIADPNFPLDTAPIRSSTDQGTPTDFEAWEAHMAYWMQQDFIEAINRANRVRDQSASLLVSPVYRLLKARVVPGYTGIPNTDMGFRYGAGLVGMAVGGAPAPAPGAPAPARPAEDFANSPTGRVSGDQYDVRRLEVSIVAASRRLPEFFKALNEVNFMTVLGINAKNVDVYEALAEGILYPDDAVQLDMLIETVWFRSWTQALMPQVVKERLGIAPPPAPAAGAPTAAPGPGPR